MHHIITITTHLDSIDLKISKKTNEEVEQIANNLVRALSHVPCVELLSVNVIECFDYKSVIVAKKTYSFKLNGWLHI